MSLKGDLINTLEPYNFLTLFNFSLLQNHYSGAQLPIQRTLKIFSAGFKQLGHGDMPPLHHTSSWRAIECDHLHFTLYYSDAGGNGGGGGSGGSGGGGTSSSSSSSSNSSSGKK